MSEYLDILLILFSLLHASSFLLSDVAGIVAGVLGEGSTDGSPAAVQAKIEEDVEVIDQYGGFPMKLTKSKTIAGTAPTLPVSLYQINDMKGFGSFFSFCSTYLYQSLHTYRVLTSVIVLCFPLSLVTL